MQQGRWGILNKGEEVEEVEEEAWAEQERILAVCVSREVPSEQMSESPLASVTRGVNEYE